MRFGICAPYRAVAVLETYPFDYLEESVQRFLIPERSQSEFEELWREARQLPVPIEAANVLFPADLRLVATPTQSVDTQRLERYMKTVLQRAEQAAIRIIVFGSGQARACPPGYNCSDAVQQIAAHLSRWSEWAQDHGVVIALEPLRYEESNILNTVSEAGALVGSIDRPAVRLLADFYHIACNNESLQDILPCSSFLSHIHVAEKQDRAAPGRHGEDFRPFFATLHQAGYDHRISIECNWQNLADEVAPAIETLREQWISACH
ncbi:MAG TPA: sugar phosphate isomerase/epimerase family protein [Ktedonobacteraceae bacterium]|nr:sugar phosphate isomerase/epimerase family protein [Ktedonobacteraceae bacterium]